jgi:hypothetical protein
MLSPATMARDDVFQGSRTWSQPTGSLLPTQYPHDHPHRVPWKEPNVFMDEYEGVLASALTLPSSRPNATHLKLVLEQTGLGRLGGQDDLERTLIDRGMRVAEAVTLAALIPVRGGVEPCDPRLRRNDGAERLQALILRLLAYEWKRATRIAEAQQREGVKLLPDVAVLCMTECGESRLTKLVRTPGFRTPTLSEPLGYFVIEFGGPSGSPEDAPESRVWTQSNVRLSRPDLSWTSRPVAWDTGLNPFKEATIAAYFIRQLLPRLPRILANDPGLTAGY